MDDDLLLDLEDLNGEEEEDEEVAVAVVVGKGDRSSSVKRNSAHDSMDVEGDGDGAGEDNDDDAGEEEDVMMVDEELMMRQRKRDEAHAALLESVKSANDVRSVAKLLHSKTFKDLLAKIEHFKTALRTIYHNTGPVEDDPEYKIILQANNVTMDIDNEILLVYKFARDHYAPKFPELEQLVPGPLDYAKVVRAIGNETDITKLDLRTACGLPNATVMIVTVTATTTNGMPLPEDKLAKVFEAVDMMMDLEAARKKIMDYVESRMSFVAPNISAILGSTTAAKLMAVAGGLTALSKIPACNLQVLGKTGKTNTGLSSVGQVRHVGFIYYSEIVTACPAEIRKKVAKMVAAKVALASRIDRSRESQDGAMGRQLREEIEKKIELVLAPPPSKKTKALPVPDEGYKKKRGGKRVRRQKESMAVTELRKAQNKMAFGVAEEEFGMSSGSSVGLGMVGQQSGKLRAIAADNRVKVNVAKKHHKFLSGSSSSTSGLSTSLAFTPVQGLELENPEAAQQRIKDLNTNYFSGGFERKE